VIPAAVRYHRASSLDDALQVLAEPDARALAGGQSLLALMKLRVARPSVLVDIARLELRGLGIEAGELRIGALVTWSELASAPALERPALAAIAECAAAIGDLQVRNRGTVGGSIAHADPSSDIPAVLLAFDAAVALRSATRTRSVSLGELFLGPFLTGIEPGELLTEIVVPVPPLGSGSAYASAEHPASGFALAGAAAIVGGDGRRSVAVTGVSDRPVSIPADDLAGGCAAIEMFGDDFASAEYRRHLAAVLARKALESAEKRAAEDARWQT
jgi:carbon-monoxide dehydrogenase medium subunit